MSIQKPVLPKGTRDFGPEQMVKRNFIFGTIKSTFTKFGYLPLETPSIENLSVLTGKYGDEGDQLLFKILNSGDFLAKSNEADFKQGYKAMLNKIAEKGLRYDLTVPFARYVVMNRHQITFPFKRYQIQPVWRADRPQKGRYREFYQCDADVVGTGSLICEAEIAIMISEVFQKLNIQGFTIKINHRRILSGLAEAIGLKNKEAEFAVVIDKLDKIGMDKVMDELKNKGFPDKALEKLLPILRTKGDRNQKFADLKEILKGSETGLRGISELEEVFQFLNDFEAGNLPIEFDITLARGLSYYTGAIFEVKVNNVNIGSLSGGGRYDNLTGAFGMPDVSGVGFSFGVDRIYDAMEELDLFPVKNMATTHLMITNFDKETESYALGVLAKIREQGISSEIYPEHAKLKKQFNYADKKMIPYVLVIGPEEAKTGKLTLKDMRTGAQEPLGQDLIIDKMKGQS